jgi:hypothetical protein
MAGDPGGVDKNFGVAIGLQIDLNKPASLSFDTGRFLHTLFFEKRGMLVETRTKVLITPLSSNYCHA